MASRHNPLAKNLIRDLAPKVKDTRKFRLAKALVFKPEDAGKIAAAFYEAKDLTGNQKLTLAEFLTFLCQSFGKEVPSEKVEETVQKLFTVQGGGEATLVF